MWPAVGESPQHSLARLLQVLLEGEHSAALAFEVLGRRRQSVGDEQRLLLAIKRIGAEEREHEALLRALQRSLPHAPLDEARQVAIRQFLRGLASRDAGIHFARIAALDSAVCLLLRSLRRAQPTLHAATLARIARDEAGHVALAAHYAQRLCEPRARIVAAEDTRAGLALLLEPSAGDFDRLGIAPAVLLRQLRTPPRFLRR
jgi:hypothetical protein